MRRSCYWILIDARPRREKFAVERAWQNAGIPLSSATLIEGHGTSTAVGDVVEAQSIVDILKDSNLPQGSIALGSVKSNIGHLKAGAGAAGFFKATMALHHKLLPPSLNFKKPNPNIDFAHSPLYVNTELRPWDILRIGPGVMRNLEAGSDGITVIAFGAPLGEENDGEIVPGWWTD